MKPVDAKNQWIVRAVLILGLTLTGFLLYVSEQEMLSQETESFSESSHHLGEMLGRELRATDELLQNISMLLSVSSVDIDSDSFRMMAEGALAKQHAVQFISFSGWVRASEKQEFEDRNWRASGVARFRIHGPGQSPASGASGFHAPIFFIEPLTPQSISDVGLDLLADPQLKPQVLEAIETGRTLPSAQTLHPREKGFGLLKAVYSGKIQPNSPESRRKAVVGILRVSLNLEKLLLPLKRQVPLSVVLKAGESEVIVDSGGSFRDGLLSPPLLESEEAFHVGGVPYQLTLRKPAPLTLSRLGIFASIFLVGLLLSWLLANRIAQLLSAQKEIQDRNYEIERKVQEKTRALQQSEALLRQVIDSNPNIIFAQTEDFKILFANHKFFQAFEKKPQDVYGQTINFDVPGQRGSRMSSLEEQILMPNGDYHWFETTRVGIELENHGACYLIVAVDISQKKINEALIAEQRAQIFSSSKLSALGEMAGGIAHEINSPLTTILLLSEQISKILKSPEPNLKIIEHHAQVISRTTGRIAKVVSGLRSFSRDGGEDRMMKFCLMETIEETLSLCREKFVSFGVHLECDLPPALPIVGRSVQISQVILNLLNNSFDAVKGRQNAWIRIQVRDLDLKIQIIVEDNGAGISEQAREKMFQPFFTTKESGQGTGLGLSIAKGIVESHRGQLTFDESAAHTRFVVELPKEVKESPSNDSSRPLG